ncbi:MAG: LD-carboxypeptidase [Bacteroidales bacterium]|nr:LD-carboxypeptidase [Bacteroidales bacterium]
MKIAIVSPGRKVTAEEMQFAIDWLKSVGKEPVYDERLFAVEHIFAGSDAFRAQVIQEYMDRDDIDAIWLARGGYGSIRVIDKLDFSRFVKHPKPFIGFSDGTVFHGMMQSLGLTSIHASMPYCLDKKTPESLQSLNDAMDGKAIHYQWDASALNRLGEAQGILVGGNLSVLYGMIGSKSFPETDGRILFLEEISEYIYHLERMMMGLKRAGLLKHLAGLVIGGLTNINDNPDPFGKSVEQAIFDVVGEYDYPVCFDFPAGHIPDNRAIVLGKTARLTVAAHNVNLQQ